MPPKHTSNNNKNKKSNNESTNNPHQKGDFTSTLPNIGANSEFPILRYMANKGIVSNFFDFKKFFLIYVTKKYSDMAETFEDIEEDEDGNLPERVLWYPDEPERPVIEVEDFVEELDQDGNPVLDDNGDPVMIPDPEVDYDPFSALNDPDGQVKKDFEDEKKIYRRDKEIVRKNYLVIFAEIWGNMSSESQAKVKEVTPNIQRLKNPLTLWNAILATHVAGNGVDVHKDRRMMRKAPHTLL